MDGSSKDVKLHAGKLVWSGEHWINALQTREGDGPTAWISLFHTRYSPAGEGTAAHISIPVNGIDVVACDNAELSAWVTQRFFSKSSYFNPPAPQILATFHRSGSSHHNPVWIIEFDNHTIVARWIVTEQPTIASGSFSPGTEHWTVLFFTDEASMEVNGVAVPGRPYPRDIWQASIGGERSSCVFALAETLLEISA